MRKILFSFLVSLCYLSAQAQFPQPYCAVTNTNSFSNVEPITLVNFAGINQLTPNAISSGSANTHIDYTTVTGTVEQGSSYEIILKGNTGGNFIDYFTVFIDWNQDGDFDETDEVYTNIPALSNSTGSTTATALSDTVKANISVPASATVGSTRMRVLKEWDDTGIDPCEIVSGYGQAQDYTLNVLMGTGCTGTPNGGTISAASTVICTPGNVMLISNAANTGTGINYQWQSSPAGANTFTNEAGTASSFDATVNASTDYRVILTCSGSTLSDTSDVISITLESVIANDDCSAPVDITIGTNYCGNTLCATSTGDPSFSASTPNNTLWYTFTPPTDGQYYFKMTRPAGSTGGWLNGWLGFFTGSCGALTEVPGTSYRAFNLASADSIDVVSVLLSASSQYFIMIDGNSGAVGSYCMKVENTPAPPANDEACNATTLVVNGAAECVNTTFATYNATSEPDNGLTCSSPNNIVWYKFTPATDGNYVIKTYVPAGSTNPLSAWVYLYSTSDCSTASSFVNEASVTCEGNTTTVGDTTEISALSLLAGVTYYIYIDGNSGDVGDLCIKVAEAPTPPVCATLTAPADMAIDVAIPSVLSWSAVPGASSYDVYVGTSNPPTTVTATVTGTTYSYAGAAYSTQYYWYVVPKNAGGSATGCDATIYSFITAAPPPPPANDDCASAIAVQPGPPVAASTVSSTQSQAGCTGTADDDIWFSFTTDASGSDVTVNAQGLGSFDGVLQVFSGDCNNLVSLACIDNSFGGDLETTTLTGLSASTVYYFRVYSWYSAANQQGSIEVSVVGAAMPVTLANFSGTRVDNVNKLTWTTKTEVNNAGFELQRSADGRNFTKLGYVAAKSENGNSTRELNYSFNDTKPYAGVSYYRLNQVDKDGKSTLSNVVAIKGDKLNAIEFSAVYPNPAKDRLNVILASPKAERVTLVVTDLSGKVIKQQIHNAVEGNNNIEVNVNSLSAGTYIIKLVCASGCETAVQKFMKN